MLYKSHILNQRLWEAEMDLLADLKEYFRQQLTKAGVSPSSDNPIYEYFNFRKRYITPKPRKVIKSAEFNCPPVYHQALHELMAKIEMGNSLVPYLSKEILNAAYNDALLSDWNIHHLHLSRRMGKDGFVQRSDYQIFACFTETDCYLIQVYPHNKPWLYSTQEMVKIIDSNWPELIERYRINAELLEKTTDEQYAKLRKSHISTFVRTGPNRIYGMIGGGYMSNGYSQSALSASDYWHNKARSIDADLRNSCLDKIIQLICQETGKCYMPLNIRLLFFKTNNQVVLAETRNHVAIEINYDEQYIRVCDPTVLF